MVDPPENVVAQKLKESAHAVPDDGGAQVAHVHLFGNVGGGEIHHHLSHAQNTARFKSPPKMAKNGGVSPAPFLSRSNK